jgi:CheY-like chemotaxis protein
LAEQQSPLVLIVDDSDDVRAMLRFVLLSRGYSVMEATNGQEAIGIARRKCPDLILMDLSMPVLDGFGAVRCLREIAEFCDVPIIAVSAHNTTDHRAKALAVGFNDYITKPIDFGNFVNLIHSLLQPA